MEKAFVIIQGDVTDTLGECKFVGIEKNREGILNRCVERLLSQVDSNTQLGADENEKDLIDAGNDGASIFEYDEVDDLLILKIFTSDYSECFIFTIKKAYINDSSGKGESTIDKVEKFFMED